jgi:hypothetical protein
VQVASWLRAYADGIVDLDGGTITAPRLELVGGKLTGNGLITGDLINGGRVFPGHSIGAITAGFFEQSSDGLLVMEIASPDVMDRLLVGNSNLTGSLDVAFIDGFLPHSGDQFKLIDGFGSITGQFTSVHIGGVAPGFEYRLTYTFGDVILTALNDASPVPEPAALSIIPICLFLIRRRTCHHFSRITAVCAH